MYRRRRPGRTFLRVFSTFALVFSITYTSMSIWSLADDRQGSLTSAEVVHVEHMGTKTFLTVQFSTKSGEVCEASLHVANAANRAVSIGEHISIHYAKTNPCLRVREANDNSEWLTPGGGMLFVIVFGVMAYLAWRRPRPALPPRYADMP
ncbi:hypothetical protein ACWDV4_09475 [Micromonospora sp. NPDC003197]